ncbi:MAG: VCBS repeat-containing protein [Deltaproteobacteria bacterium]|nr:VCBS repeat-containing protein [Deltaproteobacteria bacterium]
MSVVVYLFCLKDGCVTIRMKIIKNIGFLALLLFSFAILLLPQWVEAEERASVAISPLRVNAPEGMAYLKGAIRDMLSSRVGVGGEIHIVEETRIKEALAGYGGVAGSEAATLFLAGKVGANYVVSGSLSVLGESVSLDVKVFDVAQGKETPMAFKGSGLSALMDMVGNLATDVRESILGSGSLTKIAKTEALEVVVPDPANEASSNVAGGDDGFIIENKGGKEITLWRSRSFPRAFKAMEIADLDGDGAQEVIVIDERSLLIYDVRAGELSLRKEIKDETLYANYGVTVADMNANGSPEIYLSRMRNNRPSSAVLEVKGGELETINDGLPWLIRTLERPDTRPLLIGQRFRKADGFYGGVKILRWEGDKVKASDSIGLPDRTNLYGFTILDVRGSEKEELLSLDASDRLRLHEKEGDGRWKQVWKSPGYYGGTLNNVELPTTEWSSDTPEKINIKGKMFAARDNDGRHMVVINSNEPGGLGRVFKNITSYKSGEIFGLTWDGIGLSELWRTREISGYIADYLIGDLDSDGGDELVILVVKKQSDIRGKRESFFMTYPLGNGGASPSEQ